MIPKSHPRYFSLFQRNLLSRGVNKGITSFEGLTAHGRGEAFDYLIGEKTRDFALESIKAAAALLVWAKYPVISVNGNTAALVPGELVKLSRAVPALLEVNLFHYSATRVNKIINHLKRWGAEKVLAPDISGVSGLSSSRRMISSHGQAKADVIFVPLEDGDRTEKLINMGKRVIAVDLNPLSRTSKEASITIIDNIIRAMDHLIREVKRQKRLSPGKIEDILKSYDNRKNLSLALKFISQRLKDLSALGKR